MRDYQTIGLEFIHQILCFEHLFFLFEEGFSYYYLELDQIHLGDAISATQELLRLKKLVILKIFISTLFHQVSQLTCIVSDIFVIVIVTKKYQLLV